MINECKGNLFSVAPMGALIAIPVNTVGIAGKGMAKYMKMRWPDAFAFYAQECRRGRIRTGELKVFVSADYRIALTPTKIHWSKPSEVSLIGTTLYRLKEYMNTHDITECYMPALGCGHTTGQLDYHIDLLPKVKEVFEHSNLVIHLFKPN